MPRARVRCSPAARRRGGLARGGGARVRGAARGDGRLDPGLGSRRASPCLGARRRRGGDRLLGTGTTTTCLPRRGTASRCSCARCRARRVRRGRAARGGHGRSSTATASAATASPTWSCAWRAVPGRGGGRRSPRPTPADDAAPRSRGGTRHRRARCGGAGGGRGGGVRAAEDRAKRGDSTSRGGRFRSAAAAHAAAVAGSVVLAGHRPPMGSVARTCSEARALAVEREAVALTARWRSLRGEAEKLGGEREPTPAIMEWAAVKELSTGERSADCPLRRPREALPPSVRLSPSRRRWRRAASCCR